VVVILSSNENARECHVIKRCFLNTTGLRAPQTQPGGDQRGHGTPKFLENIVILCIERRFPKQNSVIGLKSNILASLHFLPPPNFWAGYATGRRTLYNKYVKLSGTKATRWPSDRF